MKITYTSQSAHTHLVTHIWLHILRVSAGRPGDDHAWDEAGGQSSLTLGWGPRVQAIKVVSA